MGIYVIKAKCISIMHFIISHNCFVDMKWVGFVLINILGVVGVKVVNMDFV